MNTQPVTQTNWLGLRFASTARALLAVSALAALAVPTRALAGAFASTFLTPTSQTADVGTPVSVNIVLAIPADASWGPTNGFQAWVKFDPTKLQVASISNGATSPFTNVSVNVFDNTAGTLSFKALGSYVSNATITVATIVFNPIAAGTSNVQFSNVNQYINNSPYGVNGGASSHLASVTVTAPPAVTVFASGISPVIAWDPIFPASAISPWQAESKPVPTVGYDANWVNPHPASVFPIGSHPWEFIAPFDFGANWINAWPSLTSQGPAGQSWTKYSTTVTGEGDFVLQFLADNASWIYIDGNLVGFQDQDWPHNSTGRYTIHLSGAGPHELSFIIWDGGGLAGGKFRLETVQSFQENNPGEDLPPPPPPSDSTPPVITAPADITAEATGASGAVVTFAASAMDDVDGPLPVQALPSSGSTFPLGATTVGLGAVDSAGNAAFAEFTVTVVDTTAPVITPPANIVAEATSAAGAAVTFAVADAVDLVSGSVPVVAAPASGNTFPLGVTTVALGASDAAGNAATSSFTVTVVDTTPPVITSLTPSSATLWSPNHKMVPITLTATASDNTGVASLKIVSVTSSEPDNGLGDGDTAGDIQVTGNLTVNLRAERSGKGNGRTYTITVEARDASGNASTKTVTVSVPKSQGGK